MKQTAVLEVTWWAQNQAAEAPAQWDGLRNRCHAGKCGDPSLRRQWVGPNLDAALMSAHIAFQSMRTAGRPYLLAVATVAFTTGLCLLARPVLQTTAVAMLLLLGVVVVASSSSLGPALLASLLSIAAFNFGFVPPYYSFAVADSAFLLTFAVMLVVAVVMSRLTSRIRRQAQEAEQRERRTNASYLMSRELATAAGRADQVGVAERHLGRVVRGSAELLLADSPDGDAGLLESVDVSVAAAWAREHGEAAGWGTRHFADADALALPLRGTTGPLGVALVRRSDP